MVSFGSESISTYTSPLMKEVHIDVYSRGVDVMPSDFSLKYGVSINLNQ